MVEKTRVESPECKVVYRPWAEEARKMKGRRRVDGGCFSDEDIRAIRREVNQKLRAGNGEKGQRR